MIVPEQRFDELFATLPPVTVNGKDYNVLFDFGTETQLYKFLNMKRKEVSVSGGNIYPIVWLETPLPWNGSDRKITCKPEFILATLTTSEISNRERLKVSFEPVLFPLWENIQTALRKSGFSKIQGNSENRTEPHKRGRLYYNYGTEDEQKHKATDIWDAMKIGVDVEITDHCLRTINY